jgi:hypothetical protein
MKGLAASTDLPRSERAVAHSTREPAAVDLSALDRTFEDSTGTAEGVPLPPASSAVRSSTPSALRLPPVDADHVPAVTVGAPPEAARRRPSKTTIVWCGLLAIIATEAFAIGVLARRARGLTVSAAGSDTGRLTIVTTPPDARVLIDGAERGTTPLNLSLPAGSHRLEITHGSSRRDLQIEVAAGATIAHHLELSGQAAAATTGALEIRSRPAGATVVIAGGARGRTPLVVKDLAPGVHEVLLSHGTQQIRETVAVSGDRVALVSATFPSTPVGPGSGWLVVTSPIELTVLENGRVIGTSRSDRIMVPAGKRALELANERLAYRTTQNVEVGEGKTAVLTIDPPSGAISVNASPWAEVWIRDRKVGDTPIGNLSLPLGTHELVFRHPSFRERRQEVTVTAGAPVRVSVDMRR